MLAVSATAAGAGPLGDALARHGADDIAALRAQLATPAARCTLGAIYARTGDLPRAALLLDGCDAIALDPDIADAIARASADVQRKLRASQLSAIAIDSDPPGLAVETDALPGEAIATPATIWARAGTYHVVANGQTQVVRVAAHERVSIVLEHRAPAPAAPRTHEIDFRADAPSAPAETAPPPPQKHGELMSCRYRGCDTHAGETLDDPFAATADVLPTEPPRLELGARVGTSAAFDAGASRIAPAVALDGRVHAGRFPGIGPAIVDVRLDGSRRSSDAGNFDEVGLSAQYGVVVFAPSAAWLTWLVGARGELRPSPPMTVRRGDLGYTTALELALRALPVTLGVRYDEDFSQRDRALLVELGVDLRAR